MKYLHKINYIEIVYKAVMINFIIYEYNIK